MTEETTPQDEQFEKLSLELKHKYESLVIKDDLTFEAMESFLSTGLDNIKAITAHMDAQVKEANAKHKKLTALRKRLLAPFEAVVAGAKKKLDEYSGQNEAAPRRKGARELYKAEVTDPEVFYIACIQGEKMARPEMIKPDQSMLNKMANSLKDALDIPGVEVVKEIV